MQAGTVRLFEPAQTRKQEIPEGCNNCPQCMLASCKQLQTPPDNDAYVKRAPLSPKDSRFVYDDDTV